MTPENSELVSRYGSDASEFSILVDSESADPGDLRNSSTAGPLNCRLADSVDGAGRERARSVECWTGDEVGGTDTPGIRRVSSQPTNQSMDEDSPGKQGLEETDAGKS